MCYTGNFLRSDVNILTPGLTTFPQLALSDAIRPVSYVNFICIQRSNYI